MLGWSLELQKQPPIPRPSSSQPGLEWPWHYRRDESIAESVGRGTRIWKSLQSRIRAGSKNRSCCLIAIPEAAGLRLHKIIFKLELQLARQNEGEGENFWGHLSAESLKVVLELMTE